MQTYASSVSQFYNFPGHILWNAFGDDDYRVDLWMLHCLWAQLNTFIILNEWRMKEGMNYWFI